MILLTGCGITKITHNTKMIDTQSVNQFEDDSLSIGKIWRENEILHIEVNQIAGFRLCEITPLIFENEIFLQTRHISSGRSGSEVFDIDMSSYELDDGWENRVYLILCASGNPLMSEIQTLERKKLTVVQMKN